MTMDELRFERATNFENALALAAKDSGVDREYWDMFGRRHDVSPEALKRLLEALGWNAGSFEAIEESRAARFEQRLHLGLAKTYVVSSRHLAVDVLLSASEKGQLSFEVTLEDGKTIRGATEVSQLSRQGEFRWGDSDWSLYEAPLPGEIPLGYHRLTMTIVGRELGPSNLIVSPDRAYLPERLAKGGRTGGFNVALYGLRSTRNWGCGDFTDLEALAKWAHDEVGFSFIGVNPLHALHNRVPYNTSPYLPLSMFYKNLIYIDVEKVPEFKQSTCAQRLFESARMQEKIQQLRHTEYVDYQAVAKLKRQFLKVLYREFRSRRASNAERHAAFKAYCEREGELLQRFALFCALDEAMHKEDRNRWVWGQWPVEYQSPESEATQRFAAEHERSLEFYQYVQFVIEEQLAAAQSYARQLGMPIGLYHDLAMATDSWGSDLWSFGSFYVKGGRVGAPPDDFSPEGQDWAFPPPNKEAHRDSGYRLYRESIRKIVRHGGALRVDHVMRLFRLFWIPEGMSAAQGTYVRDYAEDLMRILALESVRSENIIIGEDLGTVTDEIRDRG